MCAHSCLQGPQQDLVVNFIRNGRDRMKKIYTNAKIKEGYAIAGYFPYDPSKIIAKCKAHPLWERSIFDHKKNNIHNHKAYLDEVEKYGRTRDEFLTEMKVPGRVEESKSELKRKRHGNSFKEMLLGKDFHFDYYPEQYLPEHKEKLEEYPSGSMIRWLFHTFFTTMYTSTDDIYITDDKALCHARAVILNMEEIVPYNEQIRLYKSRLEAEKRDLQMIYIGNMDNALTSLKKLARDSDQPLVIECSMCKAFWYLGDIYDESNNAIKMAILLQPIVKTMLNKSTGDRENGTSMEIKKQKMEEYRQNHVLFHCSNNRKPRLICAFCANEHSYELHTIGHNNQKGCGLCKTKNSPVNIDTYEQERLEEQAEASRIERSRLQSEEEDDDDASIDDIYAEDNDEDDDDDDNYDESNGDDANNEAERVVEEIDSGSDDDMTTGDYSEINDDDATEAGLELLVQDLQVEDANEINYEEEEEDEEEIEDEKEKNKSSRYSRHKKNTPNIPFDLANY